jgi:hypothetical protein
VRPQLIDEFLPKLEEWTERPKGKIRADVAREKLFGLGIHRARNAPAGGRSRRGGPRSSRGGCGCIARG